MFKKITISFGIVLLLFIFTFCTKIEQKIIFSENIILSFPSDPIEFQKKFGGEATYYSGNTQIQEKTANIDKAYVDSSDFEATFWKDTDFYLFSLKVLTNNKIKVNGVNLIGKSRDDIIRIFGDDYETVGSSINYSKGFYYIAFGFDDKNIVIRYSLGKYM
jgi:hypothetical protein